MIAVRSPCWHPRIPRSRISSCVYKRTPASVWGMPVKQIAPAGGARNSTSPPPEASRTGAARSVGKESIRHRRHPTIPLGLDPRKRQPVEAIVGGSGDLQPGGTPQLQPGSIDIESLSVLGAVFFSQRWFGDPSIPWRSGRPRLALVRRCRRRGLSAAADRGGSAAAGRSVRAAPSGPPLYILLGNNVCNPRRSPAVAVRVARSCHGGIRRRLVEKPQRLLHNHRTVPSNQACSA